MSTYKRKLLQTLLISIGLVFSLQALAFDSRSCSLKELQLTNPEFHKKSFSVHFTRYGDKRDSSKSILILPPTGGATILDRSYARNFCAAGFDVYLIQFWTDMDSHSDELQFHQQLYERAQQALTLIIHPINSPFVGLLGTSVGGIQAAQSASLQERLSSVFVIVGGAPVAAITVDSDQKAMQDLKSRRFQIFHFHSREEYLKALESEIKMDPFKLPQEFKTKDLGMIIGTEDSTVPTAQQLALKELWQARTVLEFPNGHLTTILKAWWYRKKILEFFEESYDRFIQKQNEKK